MSIVVTRGLISRVLPGSIAEELDLEPGDKLLEVDGQPIKDIIDLSFSLADDNVELLVEKQNGEQEVLEIEKEYDEDLGLEFESAVFDGVRRCANRCIFCFVDQMAPGLRESLYVKDDDYRLSFLYGNFITLTNLTVSDLKRIKQLHLSPLYISVHTTNPIIRKQMLNNKNAGRILEQIDELLASGIELHTQVVLCPEINDGEVLAQTIRDLYARKPQILSMAIVPVGLSKYRENCFSLETFTKSQAKEVVSLVSTWQAKSRSETGHSFVYLADEFYLRADSPIPSVETYDEFPQLENGVGMVRSFLVEWETGTITTTGYQKPIYLDIICGISAEKFIKPLLSAVTIPNLHIRLIPVTNTFFGESITVSGLLTGRDILAALKKMPGERTGVIIPGVALRKGESVFLDNLTCFDLQRELGVSVYPAYGASDLQHLLSEWK